MEMQPEAPITDLQEVRRAKAIENSPFGPVRKFGEVMMRDQIMQEEPVIPDESNVPYTYHRKKNGDLEKLYLTTNPYFIELNQRNFLEE